MLKDGMQLLTIEADETLCMVCLRPEEHIFRKKNLGIGYLYFYGTFKNWKMNFFFKIHHYVTLLRCY